MKSMSYRIFALFLGLTLFGLNFQSCKKDFDEPPIRELPSLTGNTTVAELQALHNIGETADSISGDIIVEAIVVSSDEAGNFYKQLIVQDASGGVEIRVEMNNLYNDYPVGRQVWINCNGLYLGDYEGNYQLTINANGDRIPEGLLPEIIVAGERDQPINAPVVTIADIKSSTQYRNMLVQIDDAQFATADAGQPYADAAAQQSANRTIVDCNGEAILLRSSGYSDFVAELTPSGKGTVFGIHSNFGSDAQLYIRDTDDINFNDARCSVNVGGNLIDLTTLRAAYTGSTTVAPANSKINVYVISDRNTDNLVDQNMVVTDGTAGITIRFSSAHSFNEGDQLEIGIDGATLDEFNGLLQLEGVNTANVGILSSNNAVPATTVTLSDLNTNAETYESMLIKVVNASLSGGATYSGSLTIDDGTGSMDLFTRFGATFASDAVPCGTLEVTAIVGQFTSYQLQLRNPANDVVGGTTCTVGPANLTTIDSIRMLYTGSNVTVNAKKVRGVVISDAANGNINNQNLVLQDGTAGITLRFSNAHSFNLGDSIEVILNSGVVGEYNGLLQVDALSTTNATLIASGVTPAVRTATIAQVLANAEDWESTLIQITGVTISGDATYGFNDITDASGTMDFYTNSSANFHGQTVPTGTVNITGILGQYDSNVPATTDYQILIRSTADVQ
ncbi:hypothetical protein SapgrDRAFT_0692 [Saprospira grandis DSM 2844]|uniref:DUF5689 domain-containing protein n=1 Tax=Saprospira grandis DSM 2844 TaxID=694433 RepID=J1I180_9BACT|nr:DUF5689 domain-containing protein [Saprospira grandis]EJF52435.1 hypothetical protein SapgrDRAFT_0692 [Saprospira grandis DSM 2844]